MNQSLYCMASQQRLSMVDVSKVVGDGKRDGIVHIWPTAWQGGQAIVTEGRFIMDRVNIRGEEHIVETIKVADGLHVTAWDSRCLLARGIGDIYHCDFSEVCEHRLSGKCWKGLVM